MLRWEEASKKVEMMGREGMRVRRYENDSKRGRESERVRDRARERECEREQV